MTNVMEEIIETPGKARIVLVYGDYAETSLRWDSYVLEMAAGD